MEIATTAEDAVTSIELTGRFDAFEVEGFDAVVAPLLEQSTPHVVVHLAQVEFVDSSALAALVRSMKRAREAGGDVVLHNPSEPVTVILELTRLDAAFDITRD